MLVYNLILILITLISTLCCIFYPKTINIVALNKRSISIQQIFSILLMVTLTCISGFRDVSVGADTYNYVFRYEVIGEHPWTDILSLSKMYSFEYGFSVLCKVLYVLARDYRIFLFVSAFWTGLFFFIDINRYSKIPSLSIMIFYCWGIWGGSMNILREMLVVPLLYLSIEKARKHDVKGFFLIVLVSSLFHTAALLFLPVYFLINIKIDLKLVIFTAISSLAMAFGGVSLLRIILHNTTFGWYFDEAKSTSGLSTLVLTIIILIICYIFRKQLLETDDYSNVWTLFIMFAMISTSIGMTVAIFSRVTNIFIISIIFLFPDFFIISKKKHVAFLSLPVLMTLLIYYYYNIIMITPAASSRIIPYRTWWN